MNRGRSGLRGSEGLLRQRRQGRARREAARLAAIALLLGGLLLILLLAGALLWLRRAPLRRAAESPAAELPPPQIETVLSRRLRPAPWFIALDAQRAYIATGAPKEGADLSGYPLLGLRALGLPGGELIWEQECAGRYSAMTHASASLVLLRDTPASGLRLEAYQAASGAPAWSKDLPGESAGSLASAEGIVLLSSWSAPAHAAESGWSIRAFRSNDGAALWKIPRRLAGLREAPGATAPPRLRLEAWPGIGGYRMGNLAGLIKLSNGKTLSEFAGAGPVIDLQYDPAIRHGIALCGGTKAGEFIVEALPTGKEAPYSLSRFEAAAPGLALLAQGGWVVAAYPHAAGGRIAPMLRAYRLGQGKHTREPVYSTRFEGGTPAGLAEVPGANGEFLLGLNEGAGPGVPRSGPASLRRIRLRGEQKAWETQRYRAGIQNLAAFRHGCLLLLGDGSVERYQPQGERSEHLERLGFDELGLITSADGQALAVTSYPPEYLGGQPGLPLDLLVLK